MWLPSGEYSVRRTLLAKQTERLDAVDGKNDYWQQARAGSSLATHIASTTTQRV